MCVKWIAVCGRKIPKYKGKRYITKCKQHPGWLFNEVSTFSDLKKTLQ